MVVVALSRWVALVVAVVLLTGTAACARGTEPPAGSPTARADRSPRSTPEAQPTPTPTPSRPGSERPPQAGSDEPVTFLYTCTRTDHSYAWFTDVAQIWELIAAGEVESCSNEAQPWGGSPDAAQQQMLALSTLSYDDPVDHLQIIYSSCARPDLFTGVGGGDEGAAYGLSNFWYAANVAVACAGHPQQAQLQAAVDAAASSPKIVAALSERDLRAQGKYLTGPNVALLVGTEMPVGTWETVADRVVDCYWELSDGAGGIIDNAFISVGTRVSVRVPESVVGFTASGCGDWRWIGP